MTKTITILDIFKPHSEDKLKPCPFCGCTEIVFERYATPVGERLRVFCCGCLAGIDPGWTDSEETLIKFWNRRTPPDEPLTPDEFAAIIS